MIIFENMSKDELENNLLFYNKKLKSITEEYNILKDSEDKLQNDYENELNLILPIIDELNLEKNNLEEEKIKKELYLLELLDSKKLIEDNKEVNQEELESINIKIEELNKYLDKISSDLYKNSINIRIKEEEKEKLNASIEMSKNKVEVLGNKITEYENIISIINNKIVNNEYIVVERDINLIKNKLISKIKIECNKRIIEIYPDYKQRNIDRTAWILLKKNINGQSLTEDELNEIKEQELMHIFIDSLRNKSNEIENSLNELEEEELLNFSFNNNSIWEI